MEQTISSPEHSPGLSCEPFLKRFDVVAIGNAIVDVIARCDDAMIAAQRLTKGSMRLVDASEAEALYSVMGPAVEISGGSAANTLAGMAMLGYSCGFIGQVADDQLGKVFSHDLRALGIAYDTPVLSENAVSGVVSGAVSEATGRCLILVTPDGQRTMSTYLGASHFLSAEMISETMISAANILYLEGYLWDPQSARSAMRAAISQVRAAGGRIALTLSDTFVIERHGDDFRALLARGAIDILFANEAEIICLSKTSDLETAIADIARHLGMLIVTRSEHGAIAVASGVRHSVAAESLARVVDTTGAGDLFAAGFLSGLSEGCSVDDCLRMGAICAHAVITQIGSRVQSDLQATLRASLPLAGGGR